MVGGREFMVTDKYFQDISVKDVFYTGEDNAMLSVSVSKPCFQYFEKKNFKLKVKPRAT